MPMPTPTPMPGVVHNLFWTSSSRAKNDRKSKFFEFVSQAKVALIFIPFISSFHKILLTTLKCLSIGTPKNNEISICSKSKIDYFWVSQNLGPLQPNYNVLKYWDI